MKKSTLVNAGQRRFDPGQNAAKRSPTAVPNAVNKVKAVVTSSLTSSGRRAGPGRIRFGSFADVMDDVSAPRARAARATRQRFGSVATRSGRPD